MAARALRAACRPLSLLAACGFLMSTLALGFHKIRGAWPRPPSLGLRPISPCVPGFYESGRDSAHFLFDARYGAKDFFYSLRAGKTAATGRVRHTISCGALFSEKVVFSTGVNRKTTGFSTAGDLSTAACPHCPQKGKTKFQRMRQEKTPVSDKTAKKRRAS